MRRFPFLILLGMSCLLLAAGPPEEAAETDSKASVGTQPAAPAEVSRETHPGTTSLETADSLSDQELEIRTALDWEREQISALEVELNTAASEAEAMQLLGRIREVKHQFEREVFQIQARHARAAGNEELAAKIEAALERMDVPSPPPAPQPRRTHDAAAGH